MRASTSAVPVDLKSPFDIPTSASKPAQISDSILSMDVRATDDGHVDLDRLERTANQSKMKRWIELRLCGQDPYWPVNHQDLEPPHALFVLLAHRSGPQGLTRAMIEQSLVQLLPEVRANNPPWRGELLQLVRILRPASGITLLAKILQERHRFPSEQIDDRADIDWLLSAAAYPSDSLHRLWLEILKKPDPRHGTIAYRALAQDWQLALEYLWDFGQALRADERSILIRSAVRLAHERCASPGLFRNKIKLLWSDYEKHGLDGPVADALRSLGLPVPLPAAESAVPNSQPAKRASYSGAAMNRAAAA